MSENGKMNTRMLVNLAMLTALEIVLERFASISAWNIRIGLSFLAIAMAGMMYGPLAGGAVGAVGDILGANLFPTGPYFPGFTAAAFLTGAIYGLFLHKHSDAKHIVPAVLVQQLLVSQTINTLNISVLYGSPFGALFLTRLIQTAVLIPIQIVVLGAAVKIVRKIGREVFAA